MSKPVGVSKNAEDAYSNGAPGPCSESVLLICFCYSVHIILVTLCSLLCMSVFHVWSLSLDYILFGCHYLVPLMTFTHPEEKETAHDTKWNRGHTYLVMHCN